ncbi:MAG: hypothetical protein LC790_08595 [Actinobacteria bacterium]|nr:hypothetical protein [Actinomycetota bacterium]
MHRRTDITKMSVRFDVYQGTTCGSGTPLKSYTQQVADSGSSGDGIGTASKTVNQKTDLGSSNEQTYCVVVEVVNSPYYKADKGQTATATFYQNVGQFVTGGGWVPDPNGSRGNFGFNARYNARGQPQGQMVYVYRGDYQGERADYVIKSNSLSQLSFSGATYPMKATLSGKATIQINRSSDGAELYSEGNASFTATATDTNQSSGIGYDSYSLVVKRSSGAEYHSLPNTLLKGGNIIARPK